SSLIDLSQALDLLTAKMTAKHRYYVKKALGQNLKWKASIDISAAEDFELLHNEMTRQKKLPSIRVQPREISALLSALQTKARIFTGYLDDSVVSSCVVLTFGEKAFYLSAATSSEG